MALVSFKNNLPFSINSTRPKQAIRIHCVSYHQSHDIEVAQGSIFSRAIHIWLWIFSLFKLVWFSHHHLMQLFSGDAKAQLILKWFLGSSISSKKRTNEFNFTTMRLVFVSFLEEIDDPQKNHFEINLPLQYS